MSRPTESIPELTLAIEGLEKLAATSPSTSNLAPVLNDLKNRLSHLGILSHTDMRASQDPIVRLSELPGHIQRSIYSLTPFPFLNLPAELRNKIYPFVYGTASARIADNGRFEFKDGQLIRRNTSALLFANKQVFLESQEYIYKCSQLYFEAGFGVPHIPPFLINIPSLDTYPSLAIWTQEVAVRTGTDSRRTVVNQQIVDAVENFGNLKKFVVKVVVQYCGSDELDALLPFLSIEGVRAEFIFVWDHNLRPLRTQGVFRHARDEETLQKQKMWWEDSWKRMLESNGYEEDEAPITWRIKERKSVMNAI